MAEEFKGRGELFPVACAYAHCAAALAYENDSDRLTEDEQRVQRQFVDQSIELLRQLAASGKLSSTDLERDPDLDPIRNEPEFEGLLEELRRRTNSAGE
jgi:hypothetical protein